jgi:hypothetical protein
LASVAVVRASCQLRIPRNYRPPLPKREETVA